MTGWSATKPCAFVYYIVEAIPGYDIICSPSDSLTAANCGAGQPIANRPVKCPSSTTSNPNCGAPAIFGSSLRNGVTQRSPVTQQSKLLVPPWCDKSLTVVPCVDRYQWLNGDSKSSPNYLDVLITHHQVGDALIGMSSG
jgi:hypothetical protein